MSSGKGAFVYPGAGKKQPDDAPPEQHKCKREACAIQRCLARNDHRQERCEEQVKAWKACCERGRAAAKEVAPSA